MEKFLFIFIHIGIPGIVLLTMIFNHPRSKLGMLFTTIACISVLVFLYFWGQWPIAFSLYFKYLLPLLILGSVLKFLRRWRRKAKWLPKGFWGISRTLLTGIFGLFMSYLAFQVMDGRSYRQSEFVSLEFPLNDGKYYVALGGSNRFTNNHYGTRYRAQWYALDFNKLNSLGAVAKPIWSDSNESHAIFGEKVYCPCKGQVLEAKGSVPDNSGASMDVSPDDGMGNYISINCNGTIVTMVHLKYNSLLVKKDDKVEVGQPLAQVGNSGFSQEPHLHFQAARYQKDSVLMGIPIQFNGSYLVRNDVYRN